MLGEVEHFSVDLRVGDVLERFGRRTNFIVEVQGGRDQACAVCSHQHGAHAPKKNRLGDGDDLSSPQALAQQDIGLARRRGARSQIIGAIEVGIVDFGAGYERLHRKRLVRIGEGRGNFVRLENHIVVGPSLIALDLVRRFYGFACFLIEELPPHPIAGFSVHDMEGYPLRSRCRRIEGDRTNDLADLQIALPIRTRRHDTTHQDGRAAAGGPPSHCQ